MPRTLRQDCRQALVLIAGGFIATNLSAQPAYYWHPSIAPSGMAFYTGDLFAAWRGNLLLGGMAAETLLRLTLDGPRVVGEERIGIRRRIRDDRRSRRGTPGTIDTGLSAATHTARTFNSSPLHAGKGSA